MNIVVIIWKLDHFARNRYDSARYKNVLKRNGVRLVSATEIISEKSEGILLESVLEGCAEYFSADLSEKVIRGMTENALKCKYNGSAMIFGEGSKGRSGSIYRYYKCTNTKKRKTCNKKPVHKEWLDDLVVNAVMDMIMDDAAVETIEPIPDEGWVRIHDFHKQTALAMAAGYCPLPNGQSRKGYRNNTKPSTVRGRIMLGFLIHFNTGYFADSR